MLDKELASWVALSQVPGLGNEGCRQLLQTVGPPSAIFSAPHSVLKQQVKPSTADSIAHGIDDSLFSMLDQWLADPTNGIVTLADPDYPQSLLHIPDPPILLYTKGRRELLNAPAICIVGSRNPTVQGLRNAESFAHTLSDSGWCIVSGMALGIDAAAHHGGLQGAASSIAIVGTGLDRIYPAANRELAHLLATQGLLVSEFHLGTPPLASNFPRRNRIISGLSSGCLVVEASMQSGSLITARLALEQDRDIFAIPGSIHSPQSKGCHHLIQQGAKLVECAQDIIDELGGVSPPKIVSRSSAEKSLPIFDYLGFEPIDLNTLSHHSGLTIEELSSILLQLELEGRIATLPGGFYQRIN